MKKINLLGLLAMSIGAGAWATKLEVVPVPVNHVYAPLGFDTNDDTQIIAAGYLPNLCYKSTKNSAVVSGKNVDVSVTALKETDPNIYCLQAIVPFVETVSLGVLDRGQYNVKVNEGNVSGQRATMKVVEATGSAVDDYVYASVDYVEKITGSRTVLLKGFNPSDCFELQEIKTVSNGVDTYSVLPIMKQVREQCPMKMVPFEYEYQVPTELSASKVLLHVRIMDGKSVNSIFDNR